MVSSKTLAICRIKWLPFHTTVGFTWLQHMHNIKINTSNSFTKEENIKFDFSKY